MRGGPVPPFESKMFRSLDIDVLGQQAQVDGQFLPFFSPAIFSVGDPVLLFELKFGYGFQIGMVNSSFFRKFPDCGLVFRFAWIEVTFR